MQYTAIKNVNKYGLSRYIPESIKRRIRIRCGFGCVVCGNLITVYEHIDPEFHEAREHNENCITLLCNTCHGNVTSRIWSKEKILEANASPKCLEKGYSKFSMDVSKGPFTVQMGGVCFINTPSILRVFEHELLTITKPEVQDSPPVISASFYDSRGFLVACIYKNELLQNNRAFDVEQTGPRILFRSAPGKIDLKLRILHRNHLVIEKIDMKYGRASIFGDNDKGFWIGNGNSELLVPSKVIGELEKSKTGIVIDEDSVSLGTDEPVLVKPTNFGTLPSPIISSGGKTEVISPPTDNGGAHI